MKVTEIKKALKNSATIDIRSTTSAYGILSTWAIVHYHDNYGETTLVRVESQANDYTYDTGYTDRKPDNGKVHSSLYFPGFNGHYATQLKASVKLDGSGGWDADCPERCINFSKLMRKTIEDNNYQYVYPECQLSRVIAALEKLGATVRLTQVDGSEDTRHWKQRRREAVKFWEDSQVDETKKAVNA